MENKINIAHFKEGSRAAEVKDIWQWDYGQILRIQGLSLPTAVEIHFSLDERGGEALRRIGITQDGVTDVVIPDSMVENESAYGDSYYFFAYIYLTDETSGNTEYKIRAKVSTRSKPEGYVSGGNDTFAEILKTVNEIAEDKVDIPVPAKVGQVIAVSEVDEDGMPTRFEATPIEESDPTVPEWAKQPEKPTYTAEEVGALPVGTKIPSKTSELMNDSGFLTEHQDLSGYATKDEIPKTASEVGADASGTAESKVSAHNVSDTAHNDIRLLVQGLTERLNALADSDDETLDQMSEVVAYIKSNKSLIDAITTSKINVSDIIDNLTTNVSNKPLSAAQGAKLKALIDAIAVVELDESLSDNTKAAPAGVVGELKGDLSAKITAPSSANVGQTIVVKTIDGEGKPTEWETASFPGLDINAYELLLETTIEEAASIHEFYLPKSCRDLLMFVKLGENAHQGDFRFTVFDDFFVTVREPYFYLHIISLGDSVKRVDFFAQSEIQLMYGSSVSTRFIKLRNPQKSTYFVRSYSSLGVGAEVKFWGR